MHGREGEIDTMGTASCLILINSCTKGRPISFALLHLADCRLERFYGTDGQIDLHCDGVSCIYFTWAGTWGLISSYLGSCL